MDSQSFNNEEFTQELRAWITSKAIRIPEPLATKIMLLAKRASYRFTNYSANDRQDMMSTSYEFVCRYLHKYEYARNHNGTAYVLSIINSGFLTYISKEKKQKYIVHVLAATEDNSEFYSDPEFMKEYRAKTKDKRNTTDYEKSSKELKQHLSNKARARPQVTCPHCGKTGHNDPMRQWHFDNCKLKHMRLMPSYGTPIF